MSAAPRAAAKRLDPTMNLPDLPSLLFYVVAVLTGLCALGVVVTQNIVRAAAWLLFTLGGVAGIFFFLGADFVGATQLIVYVGGTLVLVVFGVMLTAQGPFVSLKAGAGEWGVVTVVGSGVLEPSTACLNSVIATSCFLRSIAMMPNVSCACDTMSFFAPAH